MQVKFNLINLAKSDSLYNYGMKLLCFSTEAKQEADLGWHRVGSDIQYYQNEFKRPVGRFMKTYYTLSFTHTFKYDNDQ